MFASHLRLRSEGGEPRAELIAGDPPVASVSAYQTTYLFSASVGHRLIQYEVLSSDQLLPRCFGPFSSTGYTQA